MGTKVDTESTDEDIALWECIARDGGQWSDVTEFREKVEARVRKETYAEVAEWVSEMRESGETDLRGLLWRLRA